MMLPIIYAYPCRWSDTPSRQRYLMEAISFHTRVIFLNTPMLAGKFFEARKPYAEEISKHVTVVHNAFGFRFSRIGRKLGKAAAILDALWLNGVLRELGVSEYIYWLSAPEPKMLWGMRTDKLIYDCIDPCFDSVHQPSFDRNEHFVARQAKLIFSTAEVLLDRMKIINSASYLLPNACSLEEYLPQKNSHLGQPILLRGRSYPIVGYMGTFDNRVDIETLYFVARNLPLYTFALIGRINPDQEAGVSRLRSLPNVVMPGAVSVEEGRGYTAAFDVGLIPFKPGSINDAINPVKMYMYLASGIPVVATNLREPARIVPLVYIGRTPKEFADAIVEAVSSDSRLKATERVEFAGRNTWEERAREAITYLKAHGLLEKEDARNSSEARLCH